MTTPRSIILKNSALPGKAPTAVLVEIGEPALNLADKKIYIRDHNDVVSAWNVTPEELQTLQTDVDGRISDTEKGVANGVATLDVSGKVPLIQLPDTVLGQVEYQGGWDAATNTPALPATPTDKGHYYVVSVAGTFNSIDFQVGDWIVSNGTVWEKIDNTDQVTSVNGRIGAIVLAKADVGLSNVDNTADADKPVSTATQDALALKAAITDVRFTDAREWTASTVTQAEAEAGIATTRRAWTAQRVRQAIDAAIALIQNATTVAAGLMSASDKVKLDGIESGAQANIGTDLSITGTGDTRTLNSSTGTDTALPVATLTNAGLMSIGDKSKLNGVETGAQVNTVSSVNTKTGAVVLNKTDVGLSNVDNTADVDKPVSTATATALAAKVDDSEKGVANGVATLDFNGKVPTSQINDSILGQLSYQGGWNASTDTPTLPAATTNKGDYYITSVAGTYNSVFFEVGDWIVSNGTTYDKIDNTDAVSSVQGRTGNVTITATDVGLGNVNNTSDADKPISTAQAAALAGKVDTSDSRLTDSREWTASTVTQAEAEAGVATTRRAWTAQRVRQAIDVAIAAIANATTTVAGLMSASDKTKLDGIASGAQVNPATTASRTDASTTTVLQAAGMNAHRTSGDHDARYLQPTSYASSTVGGSVKMRLSGTTLYITNDGSDA